MIDCKKILEIKRLETNCTYLFFLFISLINCKSGIIFITYKQFNILLKQTYVHFPMKFIEKQPYVHFLLTKRAIMAHTHWLFFSKMWYTTTKEVKLVKTLVNFTISPCHEPQANNENFKLNFCKTVILDIKHSYFTATNSHRK